LAISALRGIELMASKKEQPVLTLMVGLPCSGKTTLAKKLERETNAVRFTPDEWHIFLFGNDFHVDDGHDQRHDQIEALMWKLGRELLTKGISVILDFGFWAKEQRDEKRAEAKALGAKVQICYLDTPLSELLLRLEQRNQTGTEVFTTITPEDIKEWSSIFQPPEKEEL